MEILIILGLIILSGVFSMAEIAMVSARKSKLEAAAKRGDTNAATALKTVMAPNRFLSTVQIGITLIGLLTGIYSGEGMTHSMKYQLHGLGLSERWEHNLSVVIVLVAITFVSLVLGELVPKRIGLTNPEGIAKVMAKPMSFLTTITSPFVWLLTFTTDALIKLFRIKQSTDSKYTEEEIKAIIQEGTDGGEIQEIEQDIVERVFSLGDRFVSSLMTHRNDIVFIAVDAKNDEIRTIVNKEMHSLYPVFENNDKDKVMGMIPLKDLFAHLNDPDFELKKFLKKPQFISENSSVYEILKMFKTSRTHYGFIVDEFGQMQGLVTMNDLLEALVGDVSEFYDDEFDFKEMEDGAWLIDGQYPMHDFLHRFDLDDLDLDFQFNTIGGLVLHELKSIPVTLQKLEWLNFEITILDMDGARIDKISVKRIED
jgi:putative hemolysin